MSNYAYSEVTDKPPKPQRARDRDSLDVALSMDDVSQDHTVLAQLTALDKILHLAEVAIAKCDPAAVKALLCKARGEAIKRLQDLEAQDLARHLLRGELLCFKRRESSRKAKKNAAPGCNPMTAE